MRHTSFSVWTGILLMVLISTPALLAQDMRELNLQAQEAQEALEKKAAHELDMAEKAAVRSRAAIINDKAALENAIAELTAANRKIRNQVEALSRENQGLMKQEEQLSRKLKETDSMIRELVGVIRINAKDIFDLVKENLQTALEEPDTGFLDAVAGQSKFPGMDDIRRMVDTLFNQIRTSEEVAIKEAVIIDRSGRQMKTDILTLGCFTAAYRSNEEIGFLNYSEAGQKLYALSRLPSSRLQKQISGYMDGKVEAVPMDISRGAALRQLTHQMSLWDQISKGGPLVWPILAILGIGMVIVMERVIFLLRRRVDGDGLIRRIQDSAAGQDWEACQKVCQSYAGKAIPRVLKAGLECCHMAREEMENALQETILRQIPPMERFLSTLGMLAAIAPLLGLLGTVTGMIDTFHVITLHGTGDPRMMSGGISVALVTTMLGLSVAIPIMLAHTLLSRAVDNMISEMEEKAVALVNIVYKTRGSS